MMGYPRQQVAILTDGEKEKITKKWPDAVFDPEGMWDHAGYDKMEDLRNDEKSNKWLEPVYGKADKKTLTLSGLKRERS